MVEEAELTSTPSPAARGERKAPPSVQLELPAPPPIHAPFTAQQPPVRLTPFANEEVARDEEKRALEIVVEALVIVNCAVVEVAKVVGEEDERTKSPPRFLKDQWLSVLMPVERVNCGRDEVASWRSHCGDVVPIPTKAAALRKIAVSGLVEVAHLELPPPAEEVSDSQPNVPPAHVSMFSVWQVMSPFAKNCDVEATPETVIAVEDAYGRIDAVVEVAMKRSALRKPSNEPAPATEKNAKGEEVPTPTFPVFKTVKSDVVAKAAVEDEIEKSVFGGRAAPEVVVELAWIAKNAKGEEVPMPTLLAKVLLAVVEVETR
jgi:hypothetical protein